MAMTGKKPTPQQQDARDKARKELLFEAARSGNKKAQALVMVKGGKKR